MEISFSPYVPTTVIGLLGLLFGYLYSYYKNKDNRRLEEIKSTDPQNRLKAIELHLNETGIDIDTSSLSADQKYDLLKRTLNSKTHKYLIYSVTIIVLTVVASLLIYVSFKNAPNPPIVDKTDSTKIDSSKTEITKKDVDKKKDHPGGINIHTEGDNSPAVISNGDVSIVNNGTAPDSAKSK